MTRQPYVLVVEDGRPRLTRLVADYVQAAGMEVAVVDRGDAVLAQGHARAPDLVELDLKLAARGRRAVTPP
jgi:DNA-binding response OmpR family regulator